MTLQYIFVLTQRIVWIRNQTPQFQRQLGVSERSRSRTTATSFDLRHSSVDGPTTRRNSQAEEVGSAISSQASRFNRKCTASSGPLFGYQIGLRVSFGKEPYD